MGVELGLLYDTSDQALRDITDSWELEGFVFDCNGFLDRDDPFDCPACGESGYFSALWMLKSEPLGTEREFASFNRCYDCGAEWLDTDEEEAV